MILLVDDEPVFLDIAKMALLADGHEVATAGSAFQALEIAEEKEPDLILSDVRMPGMGGFEFRQAYERRHPARATPFIFMTSLGEPNEIAEGLDDGADDYVVKPVPPAVLRARVRALLRRRRRWSAPSFQGDLALFPFIKVLRFCEVSGFSGTVVFEAPDLALSLPFRAGSPLPGDSVADTVLERLYDATAGTFTLRAQPITFEELSSVEARSARSAEKRPRETELERPMGRLSAVSLGSRAIQVQTEFVTSPKEQILTVALLDGRALLKRTSDPEPPATRAQMEARIRLQHAEVEEEVRERLASLQPRSPDPAAPLSAKERFDALFEAGFESYRAGRHAEALKAWEEAHALFPSDRTVQVNIEILKKKLGQA